jgi:hypothetical protein
MNDLHVSTDAGLYCPAADVYIDPWKPVPAAIVTHAHRDHASPGSRQTLVVAEGTSNLQEPDGAWGFGPWLSVWMTAAMLLNWRRLPVSPALRLSIPP